MTSQPPKTIHVDQLTIRPGSGWGRLPLLGAVAAAIGIAASWLLGRGDPGQLYYSWLVAFMFFLSLGLGALFFVLIHFATKAGWGVVVRRLAENLSATLPVFLLLGIPILFGMEELFHWSHADAMEHDEVLRGKQGYLNVSFFTVRAVIYFACWSAIGLWYLRSSRQQDRTGDEALTRRMTALSGPAIAIFALTLTFASFDWIMSLDPHWYSTIFGVYFFAGSLVGGFASMIVLAAALVRAGYLRDIVTREHFHDLGKLLFAFTVFWAYIGFSQFFLIWYANIPEETIWYLDRLEGSWKPLTILLAVGHFGVPFFFLMSRHIKRRLPLVVLGAVWMLAVHLLDIYWMVMPVKHPEGVHLTALDATTLLSVGSVFLAVLGWNMRGRPLVPIKDPRLTESLNFENA